MTTDVRYGVVDQIAAQLAPLIARQRQAVAQAGCYRQISSTHLHVAYVLADGEAMTMSRLAEQLDVSLPNVTGIVERMVERGLVERTHREDDRRTVGVRITDAGRKVLDEIDTVKRQEIANVIARMTPEQQERALRAFTDMRVAAEQLATEESQIAGATHDPANQPVTEALITDMEAFPVDSGGVAPSLSEDPALGLSHRAKMEILFAVMLGLFLGALDQTIVGPALPTIVGQLSGNDLYIWVVTIYLLTSTISVPFWGKASDLYGRKPMFMIGITIFLIGSALSGLSQNMAHAHPVQRRPGRRRRCAVPGRAVDHR